MEHQYPDKDPSRYCYQKGCRCAKCTEANTTYKVNLNASHKARTQALTEANGGRPIPSLEHGRASSASWRGCQCEKCRGALKQQRADSTMILIMRKAEKQQEENKNG